LSRRKYGGKSRKHRGFWIAPQLNSHGIQRGKDCGFGILGILELRDLTLNIIVHYSHLSPSFFFKSIYSILPWSLIKELKAQLTKLMSKDPKTADQKPYTLNPDIMPEAILSSMAFIIKVKRPRLRIFIGRVSKIRIGRKKAFRMPRTAAANNALEKLFTCIPSIK